MPNYDYKCEKCEDVFEVFQSMSEEPLKNCPTCGKSVKRLIGGGGGILFKGSGFYQTDYRSKGYQDATKKEKPSPKSESSKSGNNKKDAK